MFPTVLQPLCQPIEHTHEDSERSMARDCGNGADQRHAEAVVQNIADIFPEGKSESDKHRIDNSVILAVKLPVIPCSSSHAQILGTFLRDGHNTEIQNHLIPR